MADSIKCPSCGENNPSGQEFCQYCQARLQPLTGNLKGADTPIKPGQAPTNKTTAELEPILPQWLRDARNSARQENDQPAAQQNIQQTSQSQKPQSAASSNDLLAGLQSQANDNEEDDTPDWLASITGSSSKSTKTQPESDVRWVEVGGKNDFAKAESAEEEVPSWLAGLQPIEPISAEKDEANDWFRNLGDVGQTQHPEPTGSIDSIENSFVDSPASDTPDWLRSMAADEDAKNAAPSFGDSAGTFTPSVSDTPDWLQQMQADDNAKNAEPVFGDASGTFTPSASDTPDWLRAMGVQENIQNEVPSDDISASTFADAPELPLDTPDWLSSMGRMEEPAKSADSAGFAESGFGEFEAAESPSIGDLPDWLNNLPKSEQPKQDTTPAWLRGNEVAQPVEEAPSWLPSDMADQLTSATPAAEPSGAELGDIPDWLKAAAPQSSIYAEPEDESLEAPSGTNTPGWLNSFQEKPALKPEAPLASEDAEFPAFTEDAQAGDNVDALFADMPDWLSKASEAPSSSIPTPITNTDAIAPGELPSWVQAMRPSDSGMSQLASLSALSDQTLESRGALAGLQGVLPAVPGFAPTSKPKAYSIKLQASDEQQAHAALLEQILAAEAAPVPIISFSALRNSRNLRWFLSFVVLIAVSVPLFLRTQMFSLPVGVPMDVNGAMQVAQSIPEGAPVLVAFDYEPARAGEMEAAAAPMFDQMILLRHPYLTFISTNETGLILAERFMSGPLAVHNYQSGSQYLKLGYLPGGQMGIRAFAQNPHITAPYDAALTTAWDSAPLNGIKSLSQFAALIVVTDDADAARVWIEQTESVRGNIPFVIVSSAQAAPMIQPYFESQQVNGLVSGLYGGALFEQYNAGRPGTARSYWDAYSLGMLLAMVLVVGGGFWNLVLGLRDRAAEREAQ